MTVQLTKDSIDLGIVVKDGDVALAFYRDTLGFELVGEMPTCRAACTCGASCAAPR